MFKFIFDAQTGVLRVRVEGSWTMPEVERYARESGAQFANARAVSGRLRLLVDLSAANILSQAIMDPLAKAGMQYSRSDDRVALLVASTLLKLQMQRMVGDAPAHIFLDENEAVQWLVHSDQSAPAASAR